MWKRSSTPGPSSSPAYHVLTKYCSLMTAALMARLERRSLPLANPRLIRGAHPGFELLLCGLPARGFRQPADSIGRPVRADGDSGESQLSRLSDRRGDSRRPPTASERRPPFALARGWLPCFLESGFQPHDPDHSRRIRGTFGRLMAD